MNISSKIIGIDVGTTSVKAAVLGLDGVVHDSFSAGYPTTRADSNIVEQNPDDWLRLIDAALAGFKEQTVDAIGLCSQVSTHVFAL